MKLKRLIILPLLMASNFSQANYNGTIGYEYDSRGQIVRVNYPDGGRVALTHSWSGQPKKLLYYSSNDQRGDVISNTYYDAAGQVVKMHLPANFDSPGGEIINQYDLIHRLSGRQMSLAGQTHYSANNIIYNSQSSLAEYQRHDDAAKNIFTNASGPALYEYTYTTKRQLNQYKISSNNQAHNRDYRYDAFGNVTYTGGLLGLHGNNLDYELSNNHVRGWNYDSEGRLIRDDDFSYHYDASGRLALITTNEEVPEIVAHYQYDSLGMRTRILDDSVVHYFHRTGDVVLREEKYTLSDSSKDSKNHLLHNNKVVMTAKELFDGEKIHFEYEHHLNDRLGSAAVIWGSNGVEYHDYTPYGQRVDRNAFTEHVGTYGYTGHEDDVTGLTYMRSRYYDPDSARFGRPDPGRDFNEYLPSSLNLYQYSQGNPVNRVDHTGKASEPCNDEVCAKGPYDYQIMNVFFENMVFIVGVSEHLGRISALEQDDNVLAKHLLERTNTNGVQVYAFFDQVMVMNANNGASIFPAAVNNLTKLTKGVTTLLKFEVGDILVKNFENQKAVFRHVQDPNGSHRWVMIRLNTFYQGENSNTSIFLKNGQINVNHVGYEYRPNETSKDLRELVSKFLKGKENSTFNRWLDGRKAYINFWTGNLTYNQRDVFPSTWTFIHGVPIPLPEKR